MSVPPNIEDFPEFFFALNGVDPFPWQRRLAKLACAGDWPGVLDLPTASGKTACIDIAVFALACQAALEPRERSAPRRIFFVVDRRVIVDEAFERARRIATQLAENPKSRPILGRVADALRRVGGLEGDVAPLAVGQLRGGIYRDQTWARTPTQPTVLASTVDQIGSRLLFRGYGLSPSLRPIHAGLAANDALILLDEAHCSNPFRQTLEAIASYRRPGEVAGLALPFRFSILSATPAGADHESTGRGRLTITDEDRADDVLRLRLAASKPVALKAVKKGKGSLVDGLANAARGMVERDGFQTVAVFVNRVATARSLKDKLKPLETNSKHPVKVILMTGRMRPIDRDELVDVWKKYLLAREHRMPFEHPIIVVSTQCLEVGADFDFEGVVTECASLDALRQRFGRLNRLGARPHARGTILLVEDQILSEEKIAALESKHRDPIYGQALPRTWNQLMAWSTPADEGEAAAPSVDFGIDALEARIKEFRSLDSEGWKLLLMPADEAPVLLPSHVDCWAQTSPSPAPDPDVALFLHGPDDRPADVHVFWRSDLVSGGDEGSHRDILSLCPPGAAECLPVPYATFRRWLAGSNDDDTPDLEGGQAESDDDSSPKADRQVLIWRGPGENGSEPTNSIAGIRPGDKVAIIATAADALKALGDVAGDGDLDLGERAYYLSRGRRILRLHPDRIASWPAGDGCETLKRLLEEDDPLSTELREEWHTALRQLSGELQDIGSWNWLRTIARSLAADKGFAVRPYPDPTARSAGNGEGDRPRGVVLVGSRALRGRRISLKAVDSQTTEDDDGSIGGRATLKNHTKGVLDRAGKFAEVCGLPDSLKAAIVSAAEWHDLGKLDRRFQAWLNNGSPTKEPLAKGLHESKQARERARIQSGYPEGGRHELVSVRLAEKLLDRLEPDIDRDLVLHLIAAHHGCARPYAALVRDERPVIVQGHELGYPIEADSATGLHRLGSGVDERFWRLTRKYGWWGLAWLEAALRLADHRQSEFEETSKKGTRP